VYEIGLEVVSQGTVSVSKGVLRVLQRGSPYFVNFPNCVEKEAQEKESATRNFVCGGYDVLAELLSSSLQPISGEDNGCLKASRP
jgi:hypothetical protein